MAHHPRRGPAQRRPPGRPDALSPSRRHGRAVTASTTAVLLAVAVVFGWLGGGPLAASEPVPPGFDAVAVAQRSYVVQRGDTVWAIARRAQPEGDIRPLVAKISDGRTGGPLRPGEVLLVP